MIRLQEIIGLPTLQYHLDNKLTLSECVYRYSSDSFIQLFAEARQALRDGKISLNEQDILLLETTDIGEYGMYEGQKVPLDLPMEDESREEEWPDTLQGNGNIIWVKTKTYSNGVVNYTPYYRGYNIDFGGRNFETIERLQKFIDTYVLSNVLYSKYRYEPEKSTPAPISEAEYRGKNVPLNKPKRGGSKKFVVYVKDPKSKNIKKVSFGGTTGLNVKIDEPGARSSFAARHKCATKKDKTKPGYWACNIGRYWKSLGGSRNFSGYW
jgi:hypothetical protein